MANSPEAVSFETEESRTQHPQPHLQTDQDGSDDNGSSSEVFSSQIHLPESISPAIRQLVKDKNREWGHIKSKGMPLTLLDLPVDVLRLIVNEITYTNDQIAVALTHSALYKLAVPNIYSRFDIVWPANSAANVNSKSIDALSYGLATLCLPNRFAEVARRLRRASQGRSPCAHRLANNDYAKYIRKFSIANGPSEWTSEYLIHKESGKMLGTLVAIAVSKMINLETFMWDMPTGILSDVFMALSSLEDDNGQTKLEKVWVRWHDNSSATLGSSTASSPTTIHSSLHAPPLPPPPAAPAVLSGIITNSVGQYESADPENTTAQLKRYSQSHVEYPTFSILPALKSLTVLDIDDLFYLDEMSLLIERSMYCLRELRVGISEKAYNLSAFAQPWDGANLQQVDHEARWPGESRIPSTRLGGVLGVLVGRIYDIRRKPESGSHERQVSELNRNLGTEEKAVDSAIQSDEAELQRIADGDPSSTFSDRERLDGKLNLETLALERVTLSIAVCSRAIDWSTMTNLTILDCQHHETLWKVLRRQFRPTAPAHDSPLGASSDYHLQLKHLSTDLVSPALISFLKETIAPNTMETIFLLDRRDTQKPPVTLEHIFKVAVKRHRNSLKKLLIDSSDKKDVSSMLQVQRRRYKYWAIKDEFFSYLTSGRMTSLRELGMVIDFKDWHMLLQQLPQMTSLRSLYIPKMVGDYATTAAAPKPKEFALQIIDIITLKREIQLSYVGLWDKYFEIVEGASSNGDNVVPVDDTDETEGNSDGDGDDETDDDDDEGNDFFNGDDESSDVTSDDDQSEADSFVEATANKSLPRLRLRILLYHDDKVELFRARHGKL